MGMETVNNITAIITLLGGTVTMLMGVLKLVGALRGSRATVDAEGHAHPAQPIYQPRPGVNPFLGFSLGCVVGVLLISASLVMLCAFLYSLSANSGYVNYYEPVDPSYYP